MACPAQEDVHDMPQDQEDVHQMSQDFPTCLKADLYDMMRALSDDMKMWIRNELEQQLALRLTAGQSDSNTMSRELAALVPVVTEPSAKKPTFADNEISTMLNTKTTHSNSMLSTDTRTSISSGICDFTGNHHITNIRNTDIHNPDIQNATANHNSINNCFSHVASVKRQLKAYGHDISSPQNSDAILVSPPTLKSSQHRVLAKWRKVLLRIMVTQRFSMVLFVVAVLNSIAIGLQIMQVCDMVPHFEKGDISFSARIYGSSVFLDAVMCIICTLELGLRIMAQGTDFFVIDWKWNIFDIACVLSQHIDFARMLINRFKAGPGHYSVIRVFRIFRIACFNESLSYCHPFRMLVRSFLHTLKWLLWACVLLGTILYVAALSMAERVALHRLSQHHHRFSKDLNVINKYFGSVGSAVLSLYQCVTGGMDWSQALAPLMSVTGDHMVWPFSLFIACTVLAFMNVITGVFVEAALVCTKKDNEQVLVHHTREIFRQTDGSFKQKLSYDVFMKELEKPEMKNYFKAIDVDPSEASSVFHLIDADSSGSVTLDEFLNGSLDLAGAAKSLDIAILKQETCDLAVIMQRGFRHIGSAVHKLEYFMHTSPSQRQAGKPGFCKDQCKDGLDHDLKCAPENSLSHTWATPFQPVGYRPTAKE